MTNAKTYDNRRVDAAVATEIVGRKVALMPDPEMGWPHDYAFVNDDGSVTTNMAHSQWEPIGPDDICWVPRYSTSIADALTAADKLTEGKYTYDVHLEIQDGCYDCYINKGALGYWYDHVEMCLRESPAEAIALALLLAVGFDIETLIKEGEG